MELQRPRAAGSPAAATEDTRQAALPPYEALPRHSQTPVNLPDLKTVLSPNFHHASPVQGSHGAPPSSLPGQADIAVDDAGQASSINKSTDNAIASPSESGSTFAPDSRTRTRSGVSLEDADVRDVAEALVGLGSSGMAYLSYHSGSDGYSADFTTVRSPATGAAHVPSHETPNSSAPREALRQEQEPLLQLLTQAHPVPGAIINGSMSAYSGAKSIAPRFVQAGINVAERNIGTPVVSAVGSVGRMTGVEAAARWYLTPREQSDAGIVEEETGRKKRRRVENDEMDVEAGVVSPRSGMRRDSNDSRADSLPAYRASRPPSYREEASPSAVERANFDRPAHTRTWSQHLILSASGLGVAMSDTSRRTLLYCLQFLGRSAEHIATVSDALKLVLEQYDQAREHWHQNNHAAAENGQRPRTPDHDDSARRLAQIIQKHCDDIWQTLKGVVHSVSNSVGGALPANAREFVRRQLMSLPQRWRKVSDGQTSDSETSRGAHRMVAFATEGLDMIGQVSQMCKATLDSAEGWVSMVGRREHQQQQGIAGDKPNEGYHDFDHPMQDSEPQHYTEKQ
jgi:transcriptional repressor OPI1